MKHIPIEKGLRGILTTVLALLAGLMLFKMAASLHWRMEHDTPLLHYAAFLMDRYDAVPYRDIFETSMPGTFAFHYTIGKLFGYGDFAFRCVDLSLLCILLAATYVFMARFGHLVAFSSSVVFGLVYLAHGQSMSLQRDYIGIIPVVLGLLCIPSRETSSVGLWRFVLVGLLFGLSSLIKPHICIALPVVVAALLVLRRKSQVGIRSSIKATMCCAVAFLIPLATAAVWLGANSALSPFARILFDYLPLHSAMTGWHENIQGVHWIFYLIENTFSLGGYGILAMVSLWGISTVLAQAEWRTMPVKCVSAIVLLSSLLLYAIYSTLGGKFWNYHWMPFAYFCSISAGLCLYSLPTSSFHFLPQILRVISLLIALTVHLNFPRYALSVYWDISSGAKGHAPKGGRVDEIATWLKANLSQGDRVQPLDWTGGSIHAMLLSEARLATKFMYDYHFYHHVSAPLIQTLRSEFIEQLQAAVPRFVISVETNKPWVSGLDSTRSFPELSEFLKMHYVVAFEGNGYLIYERKMDAAQQEHAELQNGPRGRVPF